MPEMVVMMKVSLYPAIFDQLSKCHGRSVSYANGGGQRVREKQMFHMNICLGRLYMNLERAYQT